MRTKQQKLATAFLRWAGSKRQLLPIIKQHVPPAIVRYIEPFAGSACLFFSAAPKRAILSDINAELMATYRVIRKSPEKVAQQLKGLRRSRREYLRMRSLEPARMTPPQRAARFIYLNRFCFNGLYRTNRNGEFNVPYGATGTGQLPDVQLLRACSKALHRTVLLTGDFEATLRRAKPGDFVYMDPPYAVTTRRVFNEYASTGFSSIDVVRVRRGMKQLARKGVRFLVSYAQSPEAEMLRKGFASRRVSVRRNIAGFTRQRRHSSEILIWNG